MGVRAATRARVGRVVRTCVLRACQPVLMANANDTRILLGVAKVNNRRRRGGGGCFCTSGLTSCIDAAAGRRPSFYFFMCGLEPLQLLTNAPACNLPTLVFVETCLRVHSMYFSRQVHVVLWVPGWSAPRVPCCYLSHSSRIQLCGILIESIICVAHFILINLRYSFSARLVIPPGRAFAYTGARELRKVMCSIQTHCR